MAGVKGKSGKKGIENEKPKTVRKMLVRQYQNDSQSSHRGFTAAPIGVQKVWRETHDHCSAMGYRPKRKDSA